MTEFGKVGNNDDNIAPNVEPEVTPTAPEPIPAQHKPTPVTTSPEPEVAATSDAQQESHDNYEQDELDDYTSEPQVSGKARLNTKKLVMLLIVIAAAIAGGYFALSSDEDKTEESEVIIAPKPIAKSPDFIDSGESHNSFMKKNPEAKTGNISIFNFDINDCLQRYEDEECAIMYADSLLIEENKAVSEGK